jgi:heme exporter protein A
LCDDRLPFDLDLPLAGALQFWHRLFGGAGQSVAAAMAMLDLDRLAAVPLGYCSTGQRQRARLARMALSGAPLWLLDEPANGLDSAAVAAMAALIADHRARGGAALLTSHIDLPLSPDMVLTLPDYAP